MEAARRESSDESRFMKKKLGSLCYIVTSSIPFQRAFSRVFGEFAVVDCDRIAPTTFQPHFLIGRE